MAKYMWGDEKTQFFYQLDPIRILNAVDKLGFRTTGRCLQLNSMENRVYEVEIEVNERDISSPSDRFRVVKFYRPGRWSNEQIMEEHAFLRDLEEEEIPVVSPISYEGQTLFSMDEISIWYALFPKRGGRLMNEMSDQQLEQLGRLLARLHSVGKLKRVEHRMALTPETYGMQNLQFLLENDFIPHHMRQSYEKKVLEICQLSRPLFQKVQLQRIHGDCHLGNILWGDQGPSLLDFDDMVSGPPVQDIWPIIPGQDDESRRQREVLLEAYETIHDFDRSSLNLIESLRALRFIHFSAWLAKRWSDVAFQRTFPDFSTDKYWPEQLNDLERQCFLITEASQKKSYRGY